MKIDGVEAVPIMEGDYFVLENGSVYSFKRKTPRKLAFGSRPTKNRKGEKTGIKYNTVCLSKNGKEKVVEVHRLVANCFLDNPNNYKCINHIDGNTSNNSVSNLEWCSNGHNVRHAFANGLINYYKEGKHCKLCGEKISDRNKSGYCKFCCVNFDIDKRKYGISKSIDFEKHEKFLIFLKNILDERNMTYKQLSVLTGYAEKTIENYMKFQSTSKKVRKKILEVLEINETGLPV